MKHTKKKEESVVLECGTQLTALTGISRLCRE